MQVYSVSGAVPGQFYRVWVQVDAGTASLTVGLGPGMPGIYAHSSESGQVCFLHALIM